MSAGEHGTVVKDCDEWLQKHPGDQMTGEVLALKADALLALGNKPAAAACYNESALAALSDEVLMYSLMEAARHYQDLADWLSMDTMFRKFLEKYPDHPGAVAAYYYIGQAMIKQGKIPEGKAFLAEKIRNTISDPHKEAVERLLTQLTQLCVKKPRMPAEGMELPPAPESAPLASAAASPTPAPATRPKPDPSIELEEFLAAFPDTPAAKARKLFARSELATMRHKPGESAKYLSELADSVQPEDLSPMLLGKVGDLLLARGDDARAREMYDQIIGGFGRSEYADYGYVGRGELAMRQGKFEEALKSFAFAADEIAASSKLKEATLGKAKALLALKKYPEAEKIFEMIAGIKEWRGEATAESLHSLGRIAQENKDYPKAIAYYQRIFLTHQKYPKIVAQSYLDSATCFKELGRTVEAKNTYIEMLRNEKLRAANIPELAEAQKQFDQLP
jgi:tetratricopeptide (TPR) repeat protein